VDHFHQTLVASPAASVTPNFWIFPAKSQPTPKCQPEHHFKISTRPTLPPTTTANPNRSLFSCSVHNIDATSVFDFWEFHQSDAASKRQEQAEPLAATPTPLVDVMWGLEHGVWQSASHPIISNFAAVCYHVAEGGGCFDEPSLLWGVS